MSIKDFDLEQVDVVDYLTRLEIRNVTDEGKEINFSCPFPGHAQGDSVPSAYMNEETTLWYCHGCHRKGNAITFLADLYNFSILTATDFIRQTYGGGFQDPEGSLLDEINRFYLQQEKPESKVVQTYDMSVLDNYRVDWIGELTLAQAIAAEYLASRGFTVGTLNKFEVGYSALDNRVTIPVFDKLGRLVGIKGRAIDSDRQPKYKIFGDRKNGNKYYGFQPYNPSLVVYGLDKVDPKEDHLYLVEGEFNVMAMHQLGYENTVALGGSNFTDVHSKLIRKKADEVTIFFDSDDAGSSATVKAAEALERFIQVWIMPDHKHDPAKMLEEYGEGAKAQIEELASDKCDSIQLFVQEQ